MLQVQAAFQPFKQAFEVRLPCKHWLTQGCVSYCSATFSSTAQILFLALSGYGSGISEHPTVAPCKHRFEGPFAAEGSPGERQERLRWSLPTFCHALALLHTWLFSTPGPFLTPGPSQPWQQPCCCPQAVGPVLQATGNTKVCTFRAAVDHRAGDRCCRSRCCCMCWLQQRLLLILLWAAAAVAGGIVGCHNSRC